jgi:hypothetical protein
LASKFRFIGWVYFIWFLVNFAMTGVCIWFDLYDKAFYLFMGGVAFFYISKIFLGPEKPKL